MIICITIFSKEISLAGSQRSEAAASAAKLL